MSTTTQETTLRTLKASDLKELANVCADPCVSILLPTHRTGREVQQAAIRLKNLLAQASDQLKSAGRDCSILDPVVSLSTTTDFWQHQADGLAIYLTADQLWAFQLPHSVKERSYVGDSFFLSPLAPQHSRDGHCFALTLTWDEAKLYRCDGESMELVETDLLPAKFHDLVLPRDPEENLQNTSHRSVADTPGTSTAMFHGHGEGEDKIQADRQQYLTRVDDLVSSAVYNSNLPLVVVATKEVGGHFAATTDLTIDAKIDGSPARWSDDKLNEQVRQAISDPSAQEQANFAERFGTAAAQSLASSDISEVVFAAKHGRIESVMVSESEAVDDLVNLVVIQTLRHGGSVLRGCHDSMPDGGAVAAIYRF